MSASSLVVNQESVLRLADPYVSPFFLTLVHKAPDMREFQYLFF